MQVVNYLPDFKISCLDAALVLQANCRCHLDQNFAYPLNPEVPLIYVNKKKVLYVVFQSFHGYICTYPEGFPE